MRRLNFSSLSLSVLAAVFLCTFSVTAASQSAKSVKQKNAKETKVSAEADKKLSADLESIRGFYRSAGDFCSSFSQRYHSKISHRSQQSEGEVCFQKPLKMRWDYRLPEHRSFITDGETLWAVSWAEKSVTVHSDFSQADLKSYIAFLWGGGDLLADYDIRQLEQKSVEEVVETGSRSLYELLPKQPTQFEVLYLLIDPETRRIEETVLVDSLGNLNQLLFEKPETKKKFPENYFRFTAPKGWTVERIGL